MELETTVSLDEALSSLNVAALLSENDLEQIGSHCYKRFEDDLQSRTDWEERYAKVMKLAMQSTEKKTYPWEDSSNVKFPLISQAMLQFHARAYPATVPGYDVVGCRVIGDDPDGEKYARAQRVSEHMSYQCTVQDTQWEESHDKTLIALAVLGSCFKKVYFDPIRKLNISEVVYPSDLVVNYYTKDLNKSPCVSHVIHYSHNDREERVRKGLWLEPGDSVPIQPMDTSPIKEARDMQQGMAEPAVSKFTPTDGIEQHTYLDLDGDGYEEPYIVTMLVQDRKVVRMVPRFVKENVRYDGPTGKLLYIEPEKFFQKFEFIPSPDGGFYGMGFGTLLGPINESIDTLLNLIIDQGHMKALGGGFMGKGIRMRSGQVQFRPGEWKRVESMGEDLAKNFFPLPAGGDPGALFQALELLIQIGFQLGMSTEAMVGDNPGQNTKTGVHEEVMDSSEKVFKGIYKRLYRSLTEEFKLRYRINYLNATAMAPTGKYEYAKGPQGGFALVTDYFLDDTGVCPAADPFLTDDKERIGKAMFVRGLSTTVPGYDRGEVEKWVLKEARVTGIEKIYPDPKGPKAVPPPPNPKVQVAQIQQQGKEADRKLKMQELLLNLQEDMRVNQAKITKLIADAKLAEAQAKDITDDHLLDFYKAQLDSAHKDQDRMVAMYEAMNQPQQEGQPNAAPAKQGGMGGMAVPTANPGSMGIPA